MKASLAHPSSQRSLNRARHVCASSQTRHTAVTALSRRLLARVCLVREEVQNAAREAAFNAGRAFSPTADRTAEMRGGVPRRAVAFLQVSDGSRRSGRILSSARTCKISIEACAREGGSGGQTTMLRAKMRQSGCALFDWGLPFLVSEAIPGGRLIDRFNR